MIKQCPFCNKTLNQDKICPTTYHYSSQSDVEDRVNSHFYIYNNGERGIEYVFKFSSVFISWVPDDEVNIMIFENNKTIYEEKVVDYDRFLTLCHKFQKMRAFL